ncbi:hypothetical protein AAFC00_007115 [Neodothiora populina]|uniref:C6 transcription factor n=1 Tax=Neodothiora populina TaxID=2781224 RepID=A0ABR3PC91_9PEZI
MFVTRPLLLRDYSQVVPEYESAYSDQIVRCLRAALDAIDTVMGSVSETPLFPHFWHSQYATFNALSIIYIFLIQVSKGRIPIDNLRALGRGLDEVELFKLAEVSQQHLAKATARNAPAWRYSVILEGLRNEVRRLMRTASGPTRNTSQDPGGAMEAVAASRYSAGPLDSIPNSSSTVDLDTQLTGGDLSNQSTVYSAIGGAVNASIEEVYGLNPLGDFTTDTGDLNFSLDFWPQLDSLPLSYLGHNHGEPGM